MSKLSALLVIAVLTVSAAPAAAVDQLLPGKKLRVYNTGGGGKLSLLVKTPLIIAPTSGGSSDPTTTSASLEIRAASGETATFSLPASNWTKKPDGSLYKFKNKDAPAGPSEVKVTMLKDGSKIKVSARSTGITLDESSQHAHRAHPDQRHHALLRALRRHGQA